MSTPKERADARHELPRQRERELVEVVKAAQDAADATTDAELTRSPWAAPSNSPWLPSAFGCPKATDKELTTENGQAIHQGLVSRAGLGFLHPLFESAGQPADDDDRADTSLGEPPTLSSPVLWGLRPMPLTSRAGIASTTLASFVDSLVDVGQGAICAEHRFDRLRLDGLMSTRAVNNDSVRVPEHRYAARESATGWRAAGRRGPAVWPVGCIPRGRQRCPWTHGEPRSENVFAGIQRWGFGQVSQGCLANPQTSR